MMMSSFSLNFQIVLVVHLCAGLLTKEGKDEGALLFERVNCYLYVYALLGLLGAL